ncbi:MAG: hypothetical protein RIQ81_2623, partial [Pseudomonadota bacterium]
HFYFRKGRYELDSWNNPKHLPNGIPAIMAFGAGLLGAFLGGSQPLFTGPLAKILMNADVGFELSILLSSVTYFWLRKSRLPSFSQ